ncbi:MAG: hypothetical protein J0G95_11630 [Rhizobiales bacterium]|nr:hypothetical protein [Hyphomicrobiales bacterium]
MFLAVAMACPSIVENGSGPVFGTFGIARARLQERIRTKNAFISPDVPPKRAQFDQQIAGDSGIRERRVHSRHQGMARCKDEDAKKHAAALRPFADYLQKPIGPAKGRKPPIAKLMGIHLGEP